MSFINPLFFCAICINSSGPKAAQMNTLQNGYRIHRIPQGVFGPKKEYDEYAGKN